MKVKVTFEERAKYTVELTLPDGLSVTEFQDMDTEEWFQLVDVAKPDWFRDNLDLVHERELLGVEPAPRCNR